MKKRKKAPKKIIAIILALTMIVTLLPDRARTVTVQAEEATGTEEVQVTELSANLVKEEITGTEYTIDGNQYFFVVKENSEVTEAEESVNAEGTGETEGTDGTGGAQAPQGDWYAKEGDAWSLIESGSEPTVSEDTIGAAGFLYAYTAILYAGGEPVTTSAEIKLSYNTAEDTAASRILREKTILNVDGAYVSEVQYDGMVFACEIAANADGESTKLDVSVEYAGILSLTADGENTVGIPDDIKVNGATLTAAAVKFAQVNSADVEVSADHMRIKSTKVLTMAPEEDPVVTLALYGNSGACYATTECKVELSPVTQKITGVDYMNGLVLIGEKYYASTVKGQPVVELTIYGEYLTEDFIRNMIQLSEEDAAEISAVIETDGNMEKAIVKIGYTSLSTNMEHNILVKTLDEEKTISFILDTAAPTAELKVDEGGVLTICPDDQGNSGIAKIEVSTDDGKTFIEVSSVDGRYSYTFDDPDQKNLVYFVRMTDCAGNEGETYGILNPDISLTANGSSLADGTETAYLNRTVEFAVEVGGIAADAISTDLAMAGDGYIITASAKIQGQEEETSLDINWSDNQTGDRSTGIVTCDAGELQNKNVIEVIVKLAKKIGDSVFDVASETINTNFVMDTEAPVISVATENKAKVSNDKVYLYDDAIQVDTKGEFTYIGSKEPVNEDEEITATIILTITDDNFDVDSYIEALKKTHKEENVSVIEKKNGSCKMGIQITCKINDSRSVDLDLDQIMDQAGNQLSFAESDKLYLLSNLGNGEVYDLSYSCSEGHLVIGNLRLDAQPPIIVESEGKIVFIDMDKNPVDGFYSNAGDQTVYATIDDGSGIGIETVSYWIVDENGLVEGAPASEENAMHIVYEEGKGYPLVLNIKDGVEGSLSLWIKAVDQVGNTRLACKEIQIDTLAPRVTVSYDNNDAKNSMYFKDSRILTVTVEDLNFNPDATVLASEIPASEWEQISETNRYTAAIQYEDDGVYTFGMTTTDLAGNNTGDYAEDIDYERKDENGNAQNIAPRKFVIDLTDPVITVTRDQNPDNSNYDQAIDYYGQNVTYTISVYDENLSLGETEEDTAAAKVTYTLAGQDEAEVTKEVILAKSEEGRYTGTFTLTDENEKAAEAGDILTGILMTVSDKAGRAGKLDEEESTVTDFVYSKESFTHTYAGRTVVVDKNTPEITVTLPDMAATNTTTDGTTFYFQTEQEIRIQVVDANLDMGNSKISYKVYDGTETESVNETFSEYGFKSSGESENTYEATITIKDGTELSDLNIFAKDYALNNDDSDSSTVDVVGNNDSIPAHAVSEKKYIVDGTAPTAEITVTGEGIDSYFSNRNDVYVKFKDTAQGNSGENALTAEQSVNLSIRIDDKNMDVVGGNYVNDGYIVTASMEGTLSSLSDTMPNTDKHVVYTDSMTVAPDATGYIRYSMHVQDLAGNIIQTAAVGDNTSEKQNSASVLVDKMQISGEGVISSTIVGDRERPSSIDDEKITPVITLTPDQRAVEALADGTLLYSDSMSYSLTVYDPIFTDDEANEMYSGLASVEWEVTSEQEGLFVTYFETSEKSSKYAIDYTKEASPVQKAENISIPIEITEPGESNEITLTVTATDNAGNVTTYVQKLAIDTLAPRVTVSYDNNDAKNSMYFKDARILTVTVEDLNFDPNATALTSKIAASEWKQAEGTNEYTAMIQYNVDGVYTFEMTTTDLAGNNTGDHAEDIDYERKDENGNAQNISPQKFVIDLTDPVITVSRDQDPDNRKEDNDQNIDYYGQDVTYTISVYDVNLSLGESEEEDTAATTVTYMLSGKDETEVTETVILTNSVEEPYRYTGTFTLTDENEEAAKAGDILTGILMTVSDKAGRAGKFDEEESTVTDFDHNEETFTHTYNGRPVVVDKNDPVITVTLPDSAAVNATMDGTTFYFQREQEIKIQVVDANLDLGNSTITYKIYDGTETESVSETFSGYGFKVAEGSDNTYETTITVEDGAELSDLYIYAKDYALNNDNSDSGTAHVIGNNDTLPAHIVSEKTFIVDGTVPAAEITVTGAGIDFYFTNGNDVYVKFKDTAQAVSGANASAAEQTVNLSVRIDDRNMDIDGESYVNAGYIITAGTGGNLSSLSSTMSNTDKYVVYTDSMTVAPDTTGYIRYSLHIQDLAGNNVEAVSVGSNTSGLQNTASVLVDKMQISGGVITSIIVGDRERPSSINDEKVTPVITLTPNQTAVGTLSDGTLLYSDSMSYSLTVYDPIFMDDAGKEQYSGLASVNWTVVSDEEGLIATSGNTNEYSALTQEAKYTVPVTITRVGETNAITLTVTATDNAGNATTYIQKLAIDNELPRVIVSYNNNSVLNERYFKEDRVLTVTIEDLNFDANNTALNSEIGASGWIQNGNYYTATIDYNTDGDYTFEMATTDKAKNKAEIDYTNGGANAVPQAFTIDKTQPVIDVAFNNNSVLNGKYYKESRMATVSITEHNFNSAEVQTNVTAYLDGSPISIPSVSGWSSSGDTYSANLSFTEDGDYTVVVNYTDLAGNVADTYTVAKFTIDKTAPTAVISGVANQQAFTGAVTPSVQLYDVNFDANGYSLTWTVVGMDGTKYLVPEENGTVSNITHGVQFTFNDLAETVENDGIYTLFATVMDLAGNTYSTESVMYSVNRFGSVYTTADTDTAVLLDSGFTNGAPVLKIMETNANKLGQFSITVSVNGTSYELEEGEDYNVEKIESTGSWSQYLYTILASAFTDNNGEPVQGEYVITFYSEDEAGNKNSNRTNIDTNRLGIGFIIDCEDASGWIDVTNLTKDGGNITADSTTATVYWEDNNGVAKVIIYVNGKEYIVLEGEELASCNGSYTFTLPESSEEYTIHSQIIDVAGNVTETASTTFFLNASAFAQFVHNTPVFYGTIIILILAVLVMFYLILIAKRKKEKEQE